MFGRHLHMLGARARVVGRVSHGVFGRVLLCDLFLADVPLLSDLSPTRCALRRRGNSASRVLGEPKLSFRIWADTSALELFVLPTPVCSSKLLFFRLRDTPASFQGAPANGIRCRVRGLWSAEREHTPRARPLGTASLLVPTPSFGRQCARSRARLCRCGHRSRADARGGRS